MKSRYADTGGSLYRRIFEALGLKMDDRLEVERIEQGLLIRSKTELAIESLREIQRAFATSGVTEAEFQAEGRRIREELSHERFGAG